MKSEVGIIRDFKCGIVTVLEQKKSSKRIMKKAIWLLYEKQKTYKFFSEFC